MALRPTYKPTLVHETAKAKIGGKQHGCFRHRLPDVAAQPGPELIVRERFRDGVQIEQLSAIAYSTSSVSADLSTIVGRCSARVRTVEAAPRAASRLISSANSSSCSPRSPAASLAAR